MSTYEYPKEITENDLTELFDKAKAILTKKSNVDFWAIISYCLNYVRNPRSICILF
jgi:hypothetical protein